MAVIPGSVPSKPESQSGRDGLSDWIDCQQLWLWRYLRFLGATSDVAEDLCQETLLAALHHQIQTRDPDVPLRRAIARAQPAARTR